MKEYIDAECRRFEDVSLVFFLPLRLSSFYCNMTLIVSCCFFFT